jgi:hypothetical protein
LDQAAQGVRAAEPEPVQHASAQRSSARADRQPGAGVDQGRRHPAKTDYLFYVAAVCGNGRHRFAATDAEFQRYANAYTRARDKRGGKSPTECR